MMPQNLPDRAQMDLHDADAERDMRRRASRGLFGQFVIMCGICVVALALLYLLTLAV
jgi:hypothetical protein